MRAYPLCDLKIYIASNPHRCMRTTRPDGNFLAVEIASPVECASRDAHLLLKSAPRGADLASLFMPNDMAPRPLRDQTAARVHPPSKTGRPILPATSFRLDARQVFYATMVAMPRDGAIIFSDLIGKTEVLHVTCEKCGRDGRYILARLIRNRGRDGKFIDWLDELTADCTKKQASNMNDPCGARCQDLARVL